MDSNRGGSGLLAARTHSRRARPRRTSQTPVSGASRGLARPLIAVVVEVPSESRSRERLEIAEARYRANGGLVGAILDRYKVGTVLVLAIGADDPLPDRWDARQRALAGEIDVLVIHPQSHPAVAAHVGLLAQMAINAEILRLVDGELVAEVTS